MPSENAVEIFKVSQISDHQVLSENVAEIFKVSQISDHQMPDPAIEEFRRQREALSVRRREAPSVTPGGKSQGSSRGPQRCARPGIE